MALQSYKLFIRKCISILSAVPLLILTFILILFQKSLVKQSADFSDPKEVLYFFLPIVGISVCDAVSVMVLRYISTFMRSPYIYVEIYFLTTALFISKFLNSGMILFLTNWNLPKSLETICPSCDNFLHSIQIGTHNLGDFFHRKYDFGESDFTTQFYLTFAYPLFFLQISTTISYAATLFGQYFFKIILRFNDRSFQCNPRKTKQILQQDYENLYTGDEFNYAIAYTQTTVSFFLGLSFSCGIPILNLSIFLSLLVNYWTEKVLSNLIFFFFLQIITTTFIVVKFYAKPKSIDGSLSTSIRNFMRIAFYIHCVLGFFMMSYTKIITSPALINAFYTNLANKSDGFFAKNIFKVNTPDILSRLQTPAIFFLVAIVVLIILHSYQSLKEFRKNKIKRKAFKKNKKEDCYFDHVSNDQLLKRVIQINDQLTRKEIPNNFKIPLIKQKDRINQIVEKRKTSIEQYALFAGLPFYRIEVLYIYSFH